MIFEEIHEGYHIEFRTGISKGILEGISVGVLRGIPGRHLEFFLNNSWQKKLLEELQDISTGILNAIIEKILWEVGIGFIECLEEFQAERVEGILIQRKNFWRNFREILKKKYFEKFLKESLKKKMLSEFLGEFMIEFLEQVLKNSWEESPSQIIGEILGAIFGETPKW